MLERLTVVDSGKVSGIYPLPVYYDPSMSRAGSFERTPPNTAPKVFISYSHDSEEHKSWVRAFATRLRSVGIDVDLDEWDLDPGEDIARFIEKSISSSDTVIFVCTEHFVQKANQGIGGVGYERIIASAELIRKANTTKFVPIVRDNDVPNKLPSFLAGRRYLDFSRNADCETAFGRLRHHLHGTSGDLKPSLGPPPLDDTPVAVTGTQKAAVTSDDMTSIDASLEDSWFDKHQKIAEPKLNSLGFKGSMALRFVVHRPTNRSPVELLDAIERAQVPNFKWPIGIVVSSPDACRPRPTADEIEAEVVVPDNIWGLGHASYDYWALRRNGYFYLLQYLYEDAHWERKIFIETRIVRVTESLLFCHNLYKNLDAPEDARLSIRVTHSGLANRQLTAGSYDRDLRPTTTREDVATGELTTSIEDLSEHLTDRVIQILDPMFMLFDFTQLKRRTYSEIVQDFLSRE